MSLSIESLVLMFLGCCCSLSVTYGFQLMTEAESPRHFFKFINNWVIDLNRCKCAVYDFACGLHRYTLNREPTQYEDKYFFNFNAYKPYSDAISAKNSQGREQMHSVLDKLSKSLRQRNYYNWFRYIKAFFVIRNLMSMNKL